MKKILLIDDTPHILEGLRDILEMENFEIIAAKNAQEGLDKINSEKPDLIITDILMPGISGLELLKRIKKSDQTKDIPVIILSANADSENIDIAKSLKADFYLKKPCSANELLMTVNKLIK